MQKVHGRRNTVRLVKVGIKISIISSLYPALSLPPLSLSFLFLSLSPSLSLSFSLSLYLTLGCLTITSFLMDIHTER